MSHDEMRALLGYGQQATRTINALMRHGITTEQELRNLTYNELIDVPGVGGLGVNLIVSTLQEIDRRK